MARQRRIYVSGPLDENLTPRHREFRHAILERIRNRRLDLRGFFGQGTSEGFTWDPEGISGLLDRCDGMLILAFARWNLTSLDGFQSGLATSEYVHVEGTLAVARSMPVLVVRDKALNPRGVLGHGMTGRHIELPDDARTGWLDEWVFQQGVDAWARAVHERRDVFLGYSSGAQDTANSLKLFLQGEDVTVLDWRTDFDVGENIFEEVREAAERCNCGVFLFTKDDVLAGKEKRAAPRDNVLFEAGYFSRAKGKSRTLIVLEEGAKFPADLGGDIYLSLKDRTDISSIETPLRRKLQTVGIL